MIETERLVLRQWREADKAPFRALSADPEVMEHLPELTPEAADALVDRVREAIDRNGHGWWAVERKADGAFLGWTGLVTARHDLPFQGAPEVGWRLARHAWGAGYASEAARAALGYGFDKLGAAEVVSFTTPENTRSQAVMRRIGLRRAPTRDFDHPSMPEGHRLRRHVVYAISREEWAATPTGAL